RGLHLRAVGGGTLQRAAASICFGNAVSRDDGVGGCGTRGAYDGDGFGHEQRVGDDRFVHVADESRASSGDYEGNYRDCERRSGGLRAGNKGTRGREIPPFRGLRIETWGTRHSKFEFEKAKEMAQNIGKVIQISGPAVDVQFEEAT